MVRADNDGTWTVYCAGDGAIVASGFSTNASAWALY